MRLFLLNLALFDPKSNVKNSLFLFFYSNLSWKLTPILDSIISFLFVFIGEKNNVRNLDLLSKNIPNFFLQM